MEVVESVPDVFLCSFFKVGFSLVCEDEIVEEAVFEGCFFCFNGEYVLELLFFCYAYVAEYACVATWLCWGAVECTKFHECLIEDTRLLCV